MLPKNHELASTSAEITLRKSEDFYILCFEIKCDGFLPTRVRLQPINSPCTPPRTPNSYSENDSRLSMNFFSCKIKKTKENDSNFVFQLYSKKIRADIVPFCTEKRFYVNISMISVALSPRDPFLKEHTGSRFENISCSSLNLQKGKCNNYKFICFNINFLAGKIKLRHYLDVPSTVDILPIETFLEKMNSMLVFYFCRGYFKVQYSLDQPKYISLMKKNHLLI